jgi:hypothetical protein
VTLWRKGCASEQHQRMQSLDATEASPTVDKSGSRAQP